MATEGTVRQVTHASVLGLLEPFGRNFDKRDIVSVVIDAVSQIDIAVSDLVVHRFARLMLFSRLTSQIVEQTAPIRAVT